MAEHDFETLSSETLYVGNIFALRADQVRMPGGRTARREVVEHYGAVAVVAMDENNNVAMVYQYRHSVGRRLWELPAGLLDIAGEPPALTAARELEQGQDLLGGCVHEVTLARVGQVARQVQGGLARVLLQQGRGDVDGPVVVGNGFGLAAQVMGDVAGAEASAGQLEPQLGVVPLLLDEVLEVDQGGLHQLLLESAPQRFKSGPAVVEALRQFLGVSPARIGWIAPPAGAV